MVDDYYLQMNASNKEEEENIKKNIKIDYGLDEFY